MILKLNAGDRFATKNGKLFNLVNQFQHCSSMSIGDGIYSYSFSIDDKIKQPSGGCNMSRFNKIQLGLTLNPATESTIAGASSSYNYTIYIFSLNYNVFHVQGGLAGLQFSN